MEGFANNLSANKYYTLILFVSRIVRHCPHLRFLIRLIYRILHRKAHLGTAHQTVSSTKAENTLHAIHQDCKTSAIRNNQVASDCTYDLQIIIPVYNMEKFIHRCINSVLTQKTRFSYIVVVIDDGSTDNSAYILSKYSSDNRVKIIKQNNQGFSGARNAGLKEIHARYVTFLDADDQMLSGSIETLMTIALANEADIVQGGYKRLKANQIVGSVTTKDCANATPADCLGYPWGKVFRSSLFAHVRFPESYWYEDTIVAMLLLPMASKICTTSAHVYLYTINPNGITHSGLGKPQTIDSFYITRSLLRDAESLGILQWNQYQCRQLLSQIRTNYYRTARLGENVRRAIFVLTTDLIKDLPIHIDDPLLSALRQNNYNAYERHILLCE